MTQVFDCSDEQQRKDGLAAAQETLADGRLVVIPTDTVYGLAADAFSVAGVERIFEAKGRGRDMPPPVLVPNPRTVDGLAMATPSYVRRLIKEFWPGGLTIVVRAQQSLSWDLGDTNGTVGLRMPDDDVTLSLLAETGPLAVSSANRTGQDPASTVTEAGFMLGGFVDAYLDAGERPGGTPSTIIDCTKPDPVVLRVGAISVERLRAALGEGVELIAPDDDNNAGRAGERASASRVETTDDDPDLDDTDPTPSNER
ncbi:L-threonylcarbamoyladenylate synthase [Demetria terragena]|uniref:L-threonylcarbamoyladenylate synthase n=1 Tax=Demetria terragena TaxID=63959 RepID=UPI000379D1F6|nr:L-threonylcarbamoyladenylate synthase [Demetria terragena]